MPADNDSDSLPTVHDDQDRTPSSQDAGYARSAKHPFSASARNRASVMELGSINHLRYHFAKVENPGKTRQTQDYDSVSDGADTHKLSTERLIKEELNPASVPLPPSPRRRVYPSSYRHEVDPGALRRALRLEIGSSMQRMALLELESGVSNCTELERDVLDGIVDCIIKCVRAARNYSTRIPLHESLNSSFSVFREDAIHLMGMLHSMTTRSTSARIYNDEKETIASWLENINHYLELEDSQQVNNAMKWAEVEAWQSDDSQRYLSFIKFYDDSPEPLTSVSWDDTVSQQLSTGQRLCRVFNAVVQRSSRPFGLIERFHEDTSIRYRVLENLRFWRSAVKYRFEVDLGELSFQDIYDQSELGKSQLQHAVELFCRTAMTELLSTAGDAEVSSAVDPDTLTSNVESLQIQTAGNPEHHD